MWCPDCKEGVLRLGICEKLFNLIYCVRIIQNSHWWDMLNNADSWVAQTEFFLHRSVAPDQCHRLTVEFPAFEEIRSKIASRYDF
ncbi:hypothetical protein EH32_08200 [Erythrobacter litoralis]|uniref:Uncharacterized protein n=1 Tax=Erythrobacter litoralis TaxID=39960 RepID=A0A074N096_9SPHN|nr:hypothetical protein EH32_08200 [Erythrobacter litoralis]